MILRHNRGNLSARFGRPNPLCHHESQNHRKSEREKPVRLRNLCTGLSLPWSGVTCGRATP